MIDVLLSCKNEYANDRSDRHIYSFDKFKKKYITVLIK